MLSPDGSARGYSGGVNVFGFENSVMSIVFLVLLAILQAILLVWFSMIVNVAVRVLTQKGATDSRSDDSDE